MSDLMRWSEEPVEQLNPLMERQMIHSGSMTLARLTLRKGAVVPEHAHANEQIATLIEGRMRFVVAGEELVVSAGESLVLGADVPHAAEALEDSVVFDVFSPPREDWRRGDDAYLRG
jgi:quercetin dioxygenase-like cupin family protein